MNRMFAQGQPALADAKTEYRYSMVAHCPKDGNYAFVARIGSAGRALAKANAH